MAFKNKTEALDGIIVPMHELRKACMNFPDADFQAVARILERSLVEIEGIRNHGSKLRVVK